MRRDESMPMIEDIVIGVQGGVTQAPDASGAKEYRIRSRSRAAKNGCRPWLTHVDC